MPLFPLLDDLCGEGLFCHFLYAIHRLLKPSLQAFLIMLACCEIETPLEALLSIGDHGSERLFYTLLETEFPFLRGFVFVRGVACGGRRNEIGMCVGRM